MCSHVAIRCYPEGPKSYVPDSRLAIVSAARLVARRFQGAEPRSSPLPTDLIVHGSAPSLHVLTGKPYVFRPLIVELFTVRFIAGSPKRSNSGPACHQAEAPDASSRCTMEFPPPSPAGGFENSRFLTTFNHTGLGQSRGLSASPAFHARRASDRTPGLLSGIIASGLLR